MINKILNKATHSHQDIVDLLKIDTDKDYKSLKDKALNVLKENSGDNVYFRGLVEFSNHCQCDCFYCGIRKSNKAVKRFFLSDEEVIEQAKWSSEKGFGSFVLQSGEVTNNQFISRIENIVRRIKKETISSYQPDGLGITICIGEQSKEVYQRLFDAGAHRYLLRVETTNKDLFQKIHPPEQLFEKRIESLNNLKEIGYQVGTGVMIGIPGQTLDDLANDIMFFKKMNIDMLGMGPFIVHNETPMKEYLDENKANKIRNYKLSLKMIAVCRIVLKDVNIASTTALQALYPFGREEGLNYGANVVMPLLTPVSSRKDYILYEGKPCLEDGQEDCFECLQSRIEGVGRKVGLFEYGDPKHFFNRQK